MGDASSDSANGAKRSRGAYEDGEAPGTIKSESSSDDDFGPTLPSDAPKKKKRKLPHEKLYISALPASPRYSKSLMHRDQLSFVTVTPFTDFVITSSVDGVVKFWKKAVANIESVKEFKAHVGEIKSVSASQDGRSFATAGVDKTIKIFDVVTFDLLSIVSLERPPRSVCWVHRRGASLPLLAVSFDESNDIEIYDAGGEIQKPVHTISKLHRSPVRVIAYNTEYDCALSADDNGMIEYWRPHGMYEKPDNVYKLKSSTDLFAFKKAKSLPASITISPSGQKFATFSFPDRKVRVFDFASGKLHRTYDESLTTIADMQQAGTSLRTFENVEFGRRLAIEREIENPNIQPKINVHFDESSNFILYGSLHGVKVINLLTNHVIKVYGDTEPFRSLNLSLYQGAPQRKQFTTVEMAASSNPLLQEAESRDPMVICTAVGKPRFYIFTNETDISKSTRDIQNEKPRNLNASADQSQSKQAETLGTQANIHTTMGDIELRLFPQSAPKAVENFCTHARRGYYNNTLFHRVIKKFMIQGGDPLGDGTGGESIWGKEFEDEFSKSLKHDQPFTLSMANAGPNTNGSQFFITTERCSWLDGKHTIFGRAVGGLDVVKRIENVRVWKEKPEEEIRMLSIDIN
ncbi:uncharacterized protein KY384_008986 [Bacidia gigantensis]|uniref:uncharacterized protein n=1 Tax=Bacidia gigantensis TaxID=2732470 RepID=UPI001D0486DA|nr:uncharacterized protein KY384_008986 [Bacidia gigantensis]KAG8525342.1 hypothetical protein KY384_008986 [Bacidia gigantensis]